ncbi:hypothetical protein BS627_15005 [Agrobacterium salinitolerans]|nr:hypothetical protein BS627_15005 [Agrobacterium salinitolerans]PNQ22446.1 hypothetical protein C2E26_15275 [Rhizobium sp. YIC5082]
MRGQVATLSLPIPFLLLHHVPECETVVNGCSPMLTVLPATVAALTGEIPFSGQSAVDFSCGRALIDQVIAV